MRSAVARLVDSGMLRVRHGAGTFVTTHQGGIQAGLQELRSTTRIIAEQGYSCEVVYRSREVRPATAEEAERLDGTPGMPVIAIDRCFLADDEVVAFEHDLINAAVLPDGRRRQPGSPARSSSSWSRSACCRSRPWRTSAPCTTSRSAGAPRRPERPLYVCLDQVHYLADGRPVSWSQAFFVESKFEFTLVRTR